MKNLDYYSLKELKKIMKKIPITIPYIDARDQKNVSNAVINGWGDKCFENIKNFELKFKKKIQFKIHICNFKLHWSITSRINGFKYIKKG